MSFFYLPPDFNQLLFYYPSLINYGQLQPLTLEKQESTRETSTSDPQIKIQEQSQAIQINKLPSSVSSRKKTNKLKKKTKKNKKRDTNFSSKTQKQNRNYVSILSKTFLIHLAHHPSLYTFIEAINQRYNISFAPENFEENLLKIFNLKASYIRKELVEDVLASKVCSKEFSLIFSILFRRFFKLQVFPAVFKSNKLTKKVKSKEAKYSRKVYEMFFQNQKGEEKKKNSPIQDVQKSPLQKSQQILKDQNSQSSGL